MILHGFAWRSPKNIFVQPKTLIFNKKKKTKNTSKYIKILIFLPCISIIPSPV